MCPNRREKKTNKLCTSRGLTTTMCSSRADATLFNTALRNLTR